MWIPVFTAFNICITYKKIKSRTLWVEAGKIYWHLGKTCFSPPIQKEKN